MRILMIGFGTVGQGFVELLKDKRLDHLKIVGVYDLKMGGAVDQTGIPPEKLLEAARARDLSSLPGGFKGNVSVKELIKDTPADLLVEVTYTNLKDGEPAYTYIKEALKTGKHVVTTNKGPIALYYKELRELASSVHKYLRFEGTVLSGTPVINLVQYTLRGSYLHKIRGILNGTTNYILSLMEKGVDYAAALREAQDKGYAEADPTGDVEGWDAMAKVLILANVLMDGNLSKEDVEREGITSLDVEKVREASEKGEKWKLVGEVIRENGKVKARVRPTRVKPDDRLFHVDGVVNSVVFYTDTLGEVQITGPGAGRRETGYAVLSDVLSIEGGEK